jgi:hypothetical protein
MDRKSLSQREGFDGTSLVGGAAVAASAIISEMAVATFMSKPPNT